MSESQRRLLRALVRLLGPVLLVFVILRLDDPAAIYDLMRAAEPWPLAAALLAGALVLLAKTARWQTLLALRGYRYGTGRATGAVLASLYLGMLTPGHVGDVLRIQYIRQDLGTPYAEGLAVSVMDRMCDLFVLVLFVAVAAVSFAAILHGQIGALTAVAVLVAVGAPISLLIPGLADGLLRRIYRRLTRRVASVDSDRFLAALRAQLQRRLALALVLTVAAYGVSYGQGWLIGRALGLPISFVDVTSVLAITSLLGLLPVSVSGLGVRELFLALAFPTLGMSAEQGVTFGLVVFVLMYLSFVAAGFVAWQIRPPPVGSG